LRISTITAAGSKCKASEVAARFRVTGAGQHAARAGHQREYMAGLAQVLRPRAGRDRGLHRMRAILRRDAGRDALCRLDAHREVRAVVIFGLAHHEWQAKLAAALLREREADEAAAVPGHEVDVLGPRAGRRHQEIALVLALLVVHHDDHAPRGELCKELLDRIHRTPRASSSRSR
jgi:hypothetical protein